MTVFELYCYLEERIPAALRAEWDHDGLSCCPDRSRRASRVLVALDLTEQVAEHAVRNCFDVILTHHPLLFRGIQALVDEGTVGKKLLRLACNGVAAMAFHTRLDAVTGGVNDLLAERIGLSDVQPFGPAGEVACGRIGMLAVPVKASDLALTVKKALDVPAVTLSGGGTVQRIAVLGGEGGDYVSAARAAGADLFLSGNVGYHRALDAPEEGMAIIEAGHYATEFPICARLAEWVKEADPTVTVEIMPTRTAVMI